MKNSSNRILLKLSGEVLSGGTQETINKDKLCSICQEIKEAIDCKPLSLGIVIGGGNIVRGKLLSLPGLSRVDADYMGMLGTMMNAIALKASLEDLSIPTRAVSSIPVNRVLEPVIIKRVLKHLDNQRVVIFAAGTGNPYFSTDSASSLFGLSMRADILLKGTKVDGVFDKDPMLHKEAKFYKTITYQQVLEEKLNVMDMTAFAMCQENKLPIRVFNILKKGNLKAALMGESLGTLVQE